jgi:hypothetical protein
VTVTLDRTDDLPLAFDGDLVAEASSHSPAKDRWTELRLYRLADRPGYVVESVGLSSVAGEVTIRSATVCDTVGAVIANLRKSDSSRGMRRSYLTELAWELLRSAHAAGAIDLPTVETV